MPLEVNGRIVDTDDEGFLLQPDDWDQAVAEALARQENIDLTERRSPLSPTQVKKIIEGKR